MLKFLGILVFIIVTTVAPYSSAKAGNLAFADSPESFDFNSANLIEEKLQPEIHSHSFILSQTDYIEFPAWILLKPQSVPENGHKPPSPFFSSII